MKLNWLIALFFTIAVTAYVVTDKEEDTKQQTTVLSGYEPEYIASHLYNRNFDDHGDLTSTVYADKMESYPNLELTIFYKPEITLYQDKARNKPAWRVTASEGSLFQAREQLQLRGNIVISAKDPQSQIQTIQTETLVLEIKTNQMHTDHKVTAQGPRITTTGVGLLADLNQQNVEILKHVEAQYEHHSAN